MIGWPFRRHKEPDERYALVAREAIRAISEQQVSVDELRSRVGVLVAASTVGTSFLGGVAWSQGSVSWVGIGAVVLFVAHLAVALVILWPREWVFQSSPAVMIENWIEQRGMDVDRMHRSLALYLEQYHDANRGVFKRLYRWYRWALVLLAVEIAWWLAEIAGFSDWLCDVICRQ